MAVQQMIPANEFCSHHHIELSFLRSLHDYGFIALIDRDDNNFLEPDEVLLVEKFIRLYYDLHINLEGLDVIHRLLQRQHELINEITLLRNKLHFYEDQPPTDDPAEAN
jgi:hypothetical protein